MECRICKGDMERGFAPFNVDRKGYHLHWNSLPASVCTQCGEPYFEGEVVDTIQSALEVLDHQYSELEHAK